MTPLVLIVHLVDGESTCHHCGTHVCDSEMVGCEGDLVGVSRDGLVAALIDGQFRRLNPSIVLSSCTPQP